MCLARKKKNNNRIICANYAVLFCVLALREAYVPNLIVVHDLQHFTCTPQSYERLQIEYCTACWVGNGKLHVCNELLHDNRCSNCGMGFVDGPGLGPRVWMPVAVETRPIDKCGAWGPHGYDQKLTCVNVIPHRLAVRLWLW